MENQGWSVRGHMWWWASYCVQTHRPTLLVIGVTAVGVMMCLAGEGPLLTVLTIGVGIAGGLAWIRECCLVRSDRWLFGGPVVFGGAAVGYGLARVAYDPDNFAGIVGVTAGIGGAWTAAVWVRRLRKACSNDGVTFAEGTSTIRGLAAAWWVLIGTSFIAGPFGLSSTGFDAGGLLGLAAVVAYAGPGYTEYRRAKAGR